jgi:hypothetical protein
LYKSRKGKGQFEIELEMLRADNEHLIALLKDTVDYADVEDDSIFKSSKTKTMRGSKGIQDTFVANKKARTNSADPTHIHETN